MKQNKVKILIFDIETSPDLGYVWGKYETDVLSYKKYGELLCFAWKWYGESKTYVLSGEEYKQKDLVNELWKLFDEADIIIAHNGDSFDIKKSNAFFIKHNLPSPSPYKTIDTKLVAKKYFRFNSNKLDDLGNYLNIGRKMQTGGFELWLGCMANDKRSWKKMKDYNIQDVVLLEKVYKKLLPYITNHPNLALLNNQLEACPNCNSKKLQKRGFNYSRVGKTQRVQCMSCYAWSSQPIKGGQVR